MGFLRKNTKGIRVPPVLRLVASIVLVANLSCSHLKIERPLRQSAADWPAFGRSVARTNSSAETIAPPLSLVWTHDITGGFGSGSPLVIDSLVLVGNLRGELYALNARTGQRKGWIDLCDAINGSPVVEGGVVYVCGSNTEESLIAFDMVQGKSIWKKPYGDIEVSPLLLEDRLYFGNIRGEFFCVNKRTGEKLWKFDIPENTKLKGIRSSAVADHGAVIFGADDGYMYALETETGKLRWSYDTGSPIVAPPAAQHGALFIGNISGAFLCLNAENGTLLWSYSCGTSILAGAAVSNSNVLVATAGGSVVSLRPEDGVAQWRSELGSVINASPVIAGEYIYVGTLKKTLHGIRLTDGELVFSHTVSGRIKSSPAIAYRRLYVASDDRLIMAFVGADEGQ